MKYVVDETLLQSAINAVAAAKVAAGEAEVRMLALSDWAVPEEPEIPVPAPPENPEKPDMPPEAPGETKKLTLEVMKIPVNAGHYWKTFSVDGLIVSVTPSWVTSYNLVEQEGEYLVAFGAGPSESAYLRLVIAREK